MGVNWMAVNYKQKKYFEAPALDDNEHSINRGRMVYHPSNPFPNMFLMVNYGYRPFKDGDYYLRGDNVGYGLTFTDLPDGEKLSAKTFFSDFKNVTEEIYKEYLEDFNLK